MTSPLAELAGSVRRLHRLRADLPERYRPSAAVLFATVERVRDDVAELSLAGKRAEALAVVADFEREAGTRLLGVPLYEGEAT